MQTAYITMQLKKKKSISREKGPIPIFHKELTYYRIIYKKKPLRKMK